jgi:hypothetical protein
MRSLAFISCFLVGSAAFAQVPVTQAQSQDWRFAHPGATMVGGFRVKAVLDSALVNTLIAQATAKDPSTATLVGMMRGALGGISEVRFSVRDMGKGQNPDVLALVSGAMDDAAARALAQSKATVRRINANTILVGEGQSIEDAMTRLGKPATGLQARALDRSKGLSNHDFWIAGTLPEIPAMSIPMLDSLRGLALGISLQSDLRMELDLDMNSAKMAEDLVSAARRSQVQQPGLGAALQSEADGSTARFRFSMPGDQVIQAVQQGIANGGAQSALGGIFGPSLGSGRLPTFQSTAPKGDPPANPNGGTIKIYGLDEGTREIKQQPQQ